MRVIIDRFEEDFAVIELDGRILNAPRQLFPNAKEGDTVEIAVLGRIPLEGEEPPHEIFERLRKKSRKKEKSCAPSTALDSTVPTEIAAPNPPNPTESDV